MSTATIRARNKKSYVVAMKILLRLAVIVVLPALSTMTPVQTSAAAVTATAASSCRPSNDVAWRISTMKISSVSVRGGAFRRLSDKRTEVSSSSPRRRPAMALSKRALTSTQKKPRQPQQQQQQQQQQASLTQTTRIQRALLAILVTFTLFRLWDTRSSWIGFFDKDRLQAQTLGVLKSLQEGLPKAYSYSLYVLGMAFWETLGLSTIPVETAAGMVFGWTGALLSASGKLMGACLAFGLGKTVLRDFVQDKLGSNSFLTLMRSSTNDNPMLVACLIKFSCFPETVKNYGSAILSPPITLWMFALGTLFHGGMFSALWTYLGVDSAARLEATTPLAADPLLQFLLTLALINGIVVSPLSMAYWVRTLQEKNNSRKTNMARWKKRE